MKIGNDSFPALRLVIKVTVCVVDSWTLDKWTSGQLDSKTAKVSSKSPGKGNLVNKYIITN